MSNFLLFTPAFVAPQRRRTAKDALERVGLADAVIIGRITLGRRAAAVVIAVPMVNDPALILADETDRLTG